MAEVTRVNLVWTLTTVTAWAVHLPPATGTMDVPDFDFKARVELADGGEAAPAVDAAMITITGNAPELVRATGPDVAAVYSAPAGGLDAELAGDRKGFILGRGQVGKEYYRSNDSVSFELDAALAAGPVAVEFDYWTGDHGSQRTELTWNGLAVARLNLREVESAWRRARFVVPADYVRRHERHRFTIAERHNLYARVDAVRFFGSGLRYVPPGGAPLTAEQVMAIQRGKEPGLPEHTHLPVFTFVADADAVKQPGLPTEKLEAHVDAQTGTPRPASAWVPTAAEHACGCVLFTPGYQADLHPGMTPSSGQTEPRVVLQATPGEFEPFVLAVRALRPIAGARLRAGSLVDAGGTIGTEHIDVRMVTFGPTSWTTVPIGQYRVAPRALVPARPARMAPHDTALYWLTIHVPEDAAAGRYRGHVTFEGPSCKPAPVQVELEVLPFRLAVPPDRHIGFFWSPSGYLMDPWVDPVGQMLADMQRHGVTALQAYGFEATFRKRADGGYDHDFSRFDEMVQRKRRHGIVGPIPVFAARAQVTSAVGAEFGSEAFERAYADFARAAMAEGDRRDWPDLYFYPWDEPGGTGLQKAEYLCRTLKSLVPGARTFVTCSDASAKALDRWLDARCYGHLTEARLAATRAAGDEPFEYGGVYGGSAFTLRYACGFRFWKTGARAKYMWVYSWNKGNARFDLDNSMRETGAVYPHEDGPLPTPRYEGVREGVDDLRYVHTLTEAIERHRRRNDPQSRGAADAAEGRLRQLLAPIPIDDAGGVTPEQLDATRRQIAHLIVALDRDAAGP